MAIYSNSVISKDKLLIISGQTPEIKGDIPEAIEVQVEIVLNKIFEIITEHDYQKENLLKMTVYITNASYLASVREVFTKVLGNIKPAMTLVVISELINSKFKIEIDATVDYN
ncbi:MAG: RidA family protein [Vagococcus fluvialis]